MKADSAEESEPAGAGAEKNVIGVTETETDPVSNTNTMLGTKKLLSSVRNLLDVSSKVIVKLVYKIFPWNRRARRRVMGDGEEEEL